MSLEDIPRFESEEQELRWLLTEMHREYQDKIAPIVKRLAEIEARKPPVKTFVLDTDRISREQLNSLLKRLKPEQP